MRVTEPAGTGRSRGEGQPVRPRLRAAAAAFVLVAAGGATGVRAAEPSVPSPTPKAQCGSGSKPETGPQGRVSMADVQSGRAAQGYTCNVEVVSHYGRTGGFKVFRYIDTVGHECAFYDSTLLFPTAPLLSPTQRLGVFVLDMSDPAHPKQTDTLTTPAMPSPHESLTLSASRGIPAADLGNPPGLWIFDTSDIQQRTPSPKVRVVSHLTWPEVSIPQVPIPVTIGGHPYLVEIDEYSRGTSTAAGAPVGAARMIEIGDEKHPKVISDMRLEVNQPANRAGDEVNDPGANFPVQGYAGHYCAVPSRTEPGVAACSFIMSGLRMFDIRDPYHPREIAYGNFPTNPTKAGELASSFAMSAPAFAPERGEVWYADGNSGFS